MKAERELLFTLKSFKDSKSRKHDSLDIFRRASYIKLHK